MLDRLAWGCQRERWVSPRARIMPRGRRRWLLGFCVVASAGCADLAATRDVRVTIVNERSEPVPGAVFYVEAFDASGPFAFQWRRAGRAGEVPDSAREPLKIPWRRGARLAMVALAPDHRPALVREADGRIHADGAVLVLEPGPAWSPDLADLDFPFQSAPGLAAHLEDPANAPLLAAFQEAWAAAPPGSLSPEGERKRAEIERLRRGGANHAQGTGRDGRS